jgi:hypothetical protein
MGSKITKIGITNDKISGRGGLPFFLRYIENIGLYGLISNTLISLLLVGNKGLQLKQFLKQIFAFFMDGTNMSIVSFDKKKADDGYAAILENTLEEMASSHQIKRFFAKFTIIPAWAFNKVIHELFVWRLNISKPQIIVLGIDTMVLDNDGAKKREGNEVTYKKKKGFQPLHICWGTFLIDVIFRKGSAHSNHGTDYTDRVRAVVELIRKRYSKDAPIILVGDSGFADQKAYECFEEELGIHYITTSRVYTDVKEYLQGLPLGYFKSISKNKTKWSFIEFGSKLKSWSKYRRCIFIKQDCDQNGQYILGFSKSDNAIYSNIGMCKEADEKLLAAGGSHYFGPEGIIRQSHARGSDELIHRSIKELATKERLPFKNFGMNRAYYLLLVISHFIFEAYKQDVSAEVIPITVYPNTFRRNLVDFAVKISSETEKVILNVSEAVYNTMKIEEIWSRCQSPPKIQFE